MSATISSESVVAASPQFKARAAGGLWWLCIVAGTVGFVAGAPLIVANDATATAVNILAKESLFRLGFAADLMQSGKITPVIDRTYKLSEVPAAERYLQEGHARGKVVITLE